MRREERGWILFYCDCEVKGKIGVNDISLFVFFVVFDSCFDRLIIGSIVKGVTQNKIGSSFRIGGDVRRGTLSLLIPIK